MFGAYFEDSGIPGTNPAMLTMACYVASAEQWDGFATQWNPFLIREGLKDFHMADLTFRHNGHRVGVYKDWDDERERRVLQEAHDLIHQASAIGVAMTVDVSAYREIVTPSLNTQLGGSYGFCAYQCLHQICDEGVRRNWTEPIACFFESKSGYGHQITTLQHSIRHTEVLARDLYTLRPKHWTFTGKITHPQLQAADLLAYESNHFWHNSFFGDNRATKKSFQNLILQDGLNHWGNFFREEKLRDFVEQCRCES